MSGQLLRAKGPKEPMPKHTHVVLTFTQGGQLRYVDGLHNGTGAVLLGVTSSCCPVGDRYFLRFEDVAITNAPDVHVYLSTDRGGKWSPSTSKYVGPLTATMRMAVCRIGR